MQKTLIILRHAKAEAGQDDHARKLAERGLKEAARMGAFMKAQGLSPQKIICSSSVRTKETLQHSEIEAEGNVEFSDALYNASEAQLLNIVAAQPEDASPLMLIGHNPGLHLLALGLAREGDRTLLRQMAVDFPPATLVVVDLGDIAWSDIFTARGMLKVFVTPKTI